jgi:hypothetical protein
MRGAYCCFAAMAASVPIEPDDVHVFAAARTAFAEIMHAKRMTAASQTGGYFSFTFTGDGCGGQCPTTGCYQEDLDCEYCLDSWHQFPPDASYKYDPIVAGGCSGTKVACAECEGMLGLSRYTYPNSTAAEDINSFTAARSAFAGTMHATPMKAAPQTGGYFSFTFTGDGCGGQCPTSGCYQEDLDCEYCLDSWHQFPPDASYKYDPIVAGGCSGTKVACAECEGMLGLSRYTYPNSSVADQDVMVV